MAQNSSFDVTTGVDLQEVDNAVNQAQKEIAQRYDFKGSKAAIEFKRAENLLELMRKQGWKTVLAVSDPPHMRRLAWTWHRVFKGSGLTFTLVASAAQWWSPGDWWRDEHSGAFVITEYIKIAYYVVRR